MKILLLSLAFLGTVLNAAATARAALITAGWNITDGGTA
jgi:hypothetical protein